MTTCIQASSYRPRLPVLGSSQPNCEKKKPCVVSFGVNASLKTAANASKCLQCLPWLKRPQRPPRAVFRREAPACLLGGKDKSQGDNEGSMWKSFEKAMGSFRGQSVEDVLRQQIEKQEFYDGGSGKNPPRGSGSGGDGSSGGPEDEGFAGIMDETLQVVLATMGFIFLYVYIISGEEMVRLGKDYIKFLFGGGQSVRLKRAMDKWKKMLQTLNEKTEVDKLWLEREIINTPTWYDSPAKYRRIFKSYASSNDDE